MPKPHGYRDMKNAMLARGKGELEALHDVLYTTFPALPVVAFVPDLELPKDLCKIVFDYASIGHKDQTRLLVEMPGDHKVPLNVDLALPGGLENVTHASMHLDQMLQLFRVSFTQPKIGGAGPWIANRYEEFGKMLHPNLWPVPFVLASKGLGGDHRSISLTEFCRTSTMETLPPPPAREPKWNLKTMPLSSTQQHVVDQAKQVLFGGPLVVSLSVPAGAGLRLSPLALSESSIVPENSSEVETVHGNRVIGPYVLTTKSWTATMESDMVAIVSATGSGKTVTCTEVISSFVAANPALDRSCGMFHSRRRGVLVITPNHVIDTWAKTLKTRRLLNVMVGNTAKKWAKCMQKSDQRTNVIVVSYDSFANKSIRTALVASVFDLVVVDEAHRVKMKTKQNGEMFFARQEGIAHVIFMAKKKILVSASMLEAQVTNPGQYYTTKVLRDCYDPITTAAAYASIRINGRPVFNHTFAEYRDSTRIEVRRAGSLGQHVALVWQQLAFGTRKLKNRPFHIHFAKTRGSRFDVFVKKYMPEPVSDKVLDNLSCILFNSLNEQKATSVMVRAHGERKIRELSRLLSVDAQIGEQGIDGKLVIEGRKTIIVHSHDAFSSDMSHRVDRGGDRVDDRVYRFPGVMTPVGTLIMALEYAAHKHENAGILVAVKPGGFYSKVAVGAVTSSWPDGGKRKASELDFKVLGGNCTVVASRLRDFREGKITGLVMGKNNDGVDLSGAKALVLFGYGDWRQATQAVGRVDRLSSANDPVDVIVVGEMCGGD